VLPASLVDVADLVREGVSLATSGILLSRSSPHAVNHDFALFSKAELAECASWFHLLVLVFLVPVEHLIDRATGVQPVQQVVDVVRAVAIGHQNSQQASRWCWGLACHF